MNSFRSELGIFFSGIFIGMVFLSLILMTPWSNLRISGDLLRECESDLPRNAYCELYAKPSKVKYGPSN